MYLHEVLYFGRIHNDCYDLGVVAEWSKVLIPVPWQLMV